MNEDDESDDDEYSFENSEVVSSDDLELEGNIEIVNGKENKEKSDSLEIFLKNKFLYPNIRQILFEIDLISMNGN